MDCRVNGCAIQSDSLLGTFRRIKGQICLPLASTSIWKGQKLTVYQLTTGCEQRIHVFSLGFKREARYEDFLVIGIMNTFGAFGNFVRASNSNLIGAVVDPVNR